MHIHYAYQTCDTKSYQGQERYCTNNRTELSIKSVTSFLIAVNECAKELDYTSHHIDIVADSISDELASFFQRAITKYSSEKVTINLVNLDNGSFVKSFQTCYKLLADGSADLVYQVQDDYIFLPNALMQMVDMTNRVFNETNQYCILSSFNDNYGWLTQYRFKSTPRMVVPGSVGYWITNYDLTCSFMTHRQVLVDNYDLIVEFIKLVEFNKDGLENKSLNFLTTKRNYISLVPISSVAMHLQTKEFDDPYFDWKSLWNSIPSI